MTRVDGCYDAQCFRLGGLIASARLRPSVIASGRPSTHDGSASTAEDRLRAAWLGTSSGEVFAPYDGGVDLILANEGRRDALAGKYGDWLSGRPDGL